MSLRKSDITLGLLGMGACAILAMLVVSLRYETGPVPSHSAAKKPGASIGVERYRPVHRGPL